MIECASFWVTSSANEVKNLLLRVALFAMDEKSCNVVRTWTLSLSERTDALPLLASEGTMQYIFDRPVTYSRHMRCSPFLVFLICSVTTFVVRQ